MKTLYLCGGINGLSDSDCTDWREFCKKQLEHTHKILDPMRRDYRGREDQCVNEIVIGFKRLKGYNKDKETREEREDRLALVASRRNRKHF